jgi:hypothetical protein
VEDRGAELPAANEGRMGTLVMQDDALPAVGRVIPVRLVVADQVNLGRVDGFDQDERARKRDEGGKVLCGLLAA